MSAFIVTENKEQGLLTITGSVRSDGFPRTEAFISDKKGNSVFIGTDELEGVAAITLYGGPNQESINNTIQIKISKGLFKSVIHKGKEYSIKEWNNKFK